MANWVRNYVEAHPTYGSMPVVRRNKRSITLLRPDGQYESLCLGKPCHYEASPGVWEALDTALPAGDNNIGNVDVLSLPALVAGTAAIGSLLPNASDISGTAAYTKKYYTSAGAVTDGIIWSPAAGTRWYVQSLAINVSAAATVTIEDDLTAGDSAVYKAELAANSGVVLTFPGVPLFSGEDAADLLITTNAGNVYVTAVGYEI